MSTIDFTTVLGRLLRDAALREAFRGDPGSVAAALPLPDAERASLLLLNPADLELQAQVLLKKRFASIKKLLPVTCRRLGDAAWRLFRAHALSGWPCGPKPEWQDACGFCQQLQILDPRAVCRAEFNRLRFATGTRKLALYFVSDLPVHGQLKAGVQLFMRSRSGTWQEQVLYFKI